MMALVDRIFSIQNDTEFEQIALEVFEYQKSNCLVYKKYIDYLNWPYPTKIEEIPFLPIDFFKSQKIISEEFTQEIIFKSSGTGGKRSSHYVAQTSLYEKSFNFNYEKLLGNTQEQVILALLPNYMEQGESSLIYMVDNLISKSPHPLSGFVLNDLDEIKKRYDEAIRLNIPVVIFGVSYALLDLAALNFNFEKALIIETGGMKGKRKELTKLELHKALKIGLKCENISSEYGMTELLSQAYSKENGLFNTTSLMKILIRETDDPFTYTELGKTGGINIIDLANLYSCSFIATQDLGKVHKDGFEIIGRFDNSDVRGCNLLVE